MLTIVATYRCGPGATRGVADLFDTTMRDGEGCFRPILSAATDGGAR